MEGEGVPMETEDAELLPSGMGHNQNSNLEFLEGPPPADDSLVAYASDFYSESTFPQQDYLVNQMSKLFYFLVF